MSTLWRNSIFLLLIIAAATYFIVPPEKKLRLGKDLAGGASLVYGVSVKPGDGDVIGKVIDVVKERLDPNGIMEISIVGQGADRIEITMPLPNDRVKRLRAEFDAELAALGTGAVSPLELERLAALAPDVRQKEAERIAAGNAERLARLEQAFRAFDETRAAAEGYDSAQAAYEAAQTQADAAARVSNPDDPAVKTLREQAGAAQAAYEEKVRAIAAASLAYEDARNAALVTGVNPDELRRSLTLSEKEVTIDGESGKLAKLPSPRRRAIDDLLARYPDQRAQIEAVIAKWKVYESERRALDDPQDIVRILKGAGVLNFRITVDSGMMQNEGELREQLRTLGPKAVRSDDARWYKINKIENWVRSEKDLEELKASPGAYFVRYGSYVGEEYKGEYYLLCWDKPGLRLTENDGTWNLASAFPGIDQLGRPAIDFRMDALGADKLGNLTGPNQGKRMAVLLDDEVYTAPTLQSRIANQGQITGSFSKAEIDYIVRVLSAGSLKAKLSPEPISTNVLGPQFGADNLEKGLYAGTVSFIVVGAFMILYYFTGGVIAMVALAFNALLLVAVMALNQAAFTLPGIAGVMLTFGQAVDANVLIYERMREELRRGADLRTAVRLGFDKALSAIVDGNVTTLIVCVVLGFFGTQEIQGFALTLGIGVVTTLFAQLFFTRHIYRLMVEVLRIRTVRMLPLVIPGFQQAITPSIDWLKIRGVSITVSIILTVASIALVWYKGADLLGAEFRGGTTVTVTFKEQDGKPLTMSRAEVEKRVDAVAQAAEEGTPLRQLQFAEIIAVNPTPEDAARSRTFTIKTLVTSQSEVERAINSAFADVMEAKPALRFAGFDARTGREAPIYPINTPILGDAIDRPDLHVPSAEYFGGAAIVVSGIEPPVSLADIRQRLDEIRRKTAYSDTLGRRHDVIPLEGTDSALRGAVIRVIDPDIPYTAGEGPWASEVRDREWALAREALAEPRTLSSVQSFSPAVASTFRAEAMVAMGLSTLLVCVYIWVRFNSLRYSLAAIVTTLHDCVIAVGCIALASFLHERFPGVAHSLGILPFKIDLNVMAAVLTILGFSLNGVIVVMDRVRENRGKLPYASRSAVNSAINQTFSRTIITTATTLFAVIALYVLGGDAVRVFAYTLLIGVASATYSAIGVAPTLVWVRAADKSAASTDASEPPALSRTAA